MTAHDSVVLLADTDALIREAQSAESRTRLKKLGFRLDGLPRVETARARLVESIDRRWMLAYERARHRYGRAVAAVRDRVCSGCFVTLPTTARPRDGDAGSLQVCESCGRILYWA
jgi:predicted  nucleic acid-binding Zn-ribbon protein